MPRRRLNSRVCLSVCVRVSARQPKKSLVDVDEIFWVSQNWVSRNWVKEAVVNYVNVTRMSVPVSVQRDIRGLWKTRLQQSRDVLVRCTSPNLE